MDDLHRMHVNAETITLPVATFRGATDTTTRPIYEGVLLKRCSVSPKLSTNVFRLESA